jgi:hypothetical protein
VAIQEAEVNVDREIEVEEQKSEERVKEKMAELNSEIEYYDLHMTMKTQVRK